MVTPLRLVCWVRVLQVVQKPQRRGAELFASQLSDWLSRHGHVSSAVYLYTFDGTTIPRGQEDVILEGEERSFVERALNPRLLLELGRHVDRWRPDVVQVNGARAVKYGAALRATRPIRSHPWRLVYRNIDSPRFWVRGRLKAAIYRRLVMSQMDGVVGVSQQTLDECRSFYRLAVPHTVVENAVELASLERNLDRILTRARFGASETDCVLLFAGALGPQKRPDRFVRLISALSSRRVNVRAWLAGDGPLRAEMEERARDLGLQDRVRFLGSVSELGPILDAADVFVSTSDTEGIPAVVIEASYLRRPVVGFRVGGMHECVKHGQTGLLVAPGDEDALQLAVESLLDDSQLARELGTNGREFVRERFSMERAGRGYEAFYQLLLTSR